VHSAQYDVKVIAGILFIQEDSQSDSSRLVHVRENLTSFGVSVILVK